MTKIEDTPPLTDAETLQRQLEDVVEELDAQEKEITRLRHALDKAELELRHLKETEGVEWLSTPTIDRLQDAEDRAIKAERERDDAEQAARVEASARRQFMQERDEALEALRGVYPHLTPNVSLNNRVGEILAKHGGDRD